MVVGIGYQSDETSRAGHDKAVRQLFVEHALQSRVIKTDSGHQRQRLNPDGTIRAVAPATDLEAQMFDLLCTPDSQWAVR